MNIAKSIIGPNSSIKLLFSKLTHLHPPNKGIVMHKAFSKLTGSV
jgi:hypothetical protein